MADSPLLNPDSIRVIDIPACGEFPAHTLAIPASWSERRFMRWITYELPHGLTSGNYHVHLRLNLFCARARLSFAYSKGWPTPSA